MSEPINSVRKLAGYKRALEEAGIAFDDALVAEGDYSYDSELKHLLICLSSLTNRQLLSQLQMKWR